MLTILCCLPICSCFLFYWSVKSSSRILEPGIKPQVGSTPESGVPSREVASFGVALPSWLTEGYFLNCQLPLGCTWPEPYPHLPPVLGWSGCLRCISQAPPMSWDWGQCQATMSPIATSSKTAAKEEKSGTHVKKGSWSERNRKVRDTANIEKKGRETARNKDETVGKEVKDWWP